MAQLDDSGLRP